jgi:curved DNA-binding protein CbpA
MDVSKQDGFIDYYQLLGLSPAAEIPEIRRAYIKKAKKQHPDAGGSTESMRELNRAYKTLASSSSKAAYDMMHSFQSGTTKPSDYKYTDGRKVNDITDMNDEEIDAFLDNLLFNEYRDGVPKEGRAKTHWFKKIFG